MAEDAVKKCEKCADRLGFVDRVVGKIISRKFLVFGTATALLTWAGLDSETWGMIAMIYIGSQSVIDAAVAWRHGPGR